MKYYLLRHGETFYTQNNMDYGENQHTAEIIPEGFAAIKRAGEFLKGVESDHNAASEFLRVQQTVKVISDISGHEFVKDKRLNEIMWDKDPKAFLYENTETTDDLRKRVKDFIDEMEGSGFETVMVATHGGVIAAFKNLLVKDSFLESDLMDFPPPGVMTIVDGKNMEEIDFRR